MEDEYIIRNISDTAFWMAVYRARETERRIPLFKDPFADRLAGEHGKTIAKAMAARVGNEWAFIVRTHLFDTFILVMSEGLIIYLSTEEVVALAKDLAAQQSFQHWVTDLASPGLLKMIMKQIGSQLSRANAPMKFAPPEGPEFFETCGWHASDVRSMLKTAAQLQRVGWLFRLLSRLPESNGKQGSRPWSAVCLLERT